MFGTGLLTGFILFPILLIILVAAIAKIIGLDNKPVKKPYIDIGTPTATQRIIENHYHYHAAPATQQQPLQPTWKVLEEVKPKKKVKKSKKVKS